MHNVVSAKSNHIWAPKRQSKSASVPLDCYENFKYSYMPVSCQISMSSFYILNWVRVQAILIIDKNI